MRTIRRDPATDCDGTVEQEEATGGRGPGGAPGSAPGAAPEQWDPRGPGGGGGALSTVRTIAVKALSSVL